MSPYLDPPVNPYDSNIQDYEPQTLPWDEIIRRAVKAGALSLRVCLPCEVIKVSGNQKVDVQPTLQVRYIDQDFGTNMPAIQNVPVSMPMGADYSIKLPVAAGDTGHLVFADRSLDAWLAGGGEIVDPQDSRQHDISDAIFVPGLVPFSNQTTDETTDLVVTNGKGILKVQKAGTLIFTNGENELMDLLTQITQQAQTLSETLSKDTVNTIFGPQMLNAFEQYAEIADMLQQLLNKLDTLKGT